MQVATTLDFWQKQYDLTDEDAAQSVDQNFETVNLGSLAFQENVLDTPSITTRAGIYVYLNALVGNGPQRDCVLYVVNSHSSKLDPCLMIHRCCSISMQDTR